MIYDLSFRKVGDFLRAALEKGYTPHSGDLVFEYYDDRSSVGVRYTLDMFWRPRTRHAVADGKPFNLPEEDRRSALITRADPETGEPASYYLYGWDNTNRRWAYQK